MIEVWKTAGGTWAAMDKSRYEKAVSGITKREALENLETLIAHPGYYLIQQRDGHHRVVESSTPAARTA